VLIAAGVGKPKRNELAGYGPEPLIIVDNPPYFGKLPEPVK